MNGAAISIRHAWRAPVPGWTRRFLTRDFPSAALEPYGIDAQHPDAFVAHLIDLDAASVCAAVRSQRESLQHPSYSARELLDTFRSLELATTVAALEPMQDLL